MKWMFKTRGILSTLAMVLLAVFITACSSGDDDNGVATSQSFNASGSAGELITYTIDTTNLTYSYEIVESEYGLEGTTGSGTLALNADGTYSPSNDPSVDLVLLGNTLLVGGVDVTIGGLDTTMLFAGVPALTTSYTAAEIAGTYNYIGYGCAGPLTAGACAAGYVSHYGTFEVAADGQSVQICYAGNIDDQPSDPCLGIEDGDVTDLGNGRMLVETAGGLEIGTVMLLPAATGGKIIICDLKDEPDPALDQGPGIVVGVKKQDISAEDLGGTYRYNDDEGDYGEVEVDNATNTYQDTWWDPQGNPTSYSGAFTRNDPWEGWCRDLVEDTIILILPGDGVFIETDRIDEDWICVGGLIP